MRTKGMLASTCVAGVVFFSCAAPPTQLYFNVQSGLLVRVLRYAETPLGREQDVTVRPAGRSGTVT